MKIFLRIISVFLLLAIIGAGALMYLLHEALKPVDNTGSQPSQVIEIVPGQSAGDIAQLLEEKKLIRSALAFRAVLRWKKLGNALKTGHFELSPQASPLLIIGTLVEGKPLTKKLTFPEGLTLAQTCAVVKKAKTCDVEEFRHLITTQGKQFGDFPANLEGYLLPDTYELPWVCDAKTLVTIMTRRFDELARPLLDKTSPLGLSDTVVLASLVEREAQVASERPVIAGVYINRLKDGMLLQCDATIQYALGKQKEYLLYSDLKLDSPYNTYIYPGLPPGPICSPGLAALEAAAHPKKSPYYYYVRNDVKGDGSHVFSRNGAEHNDAIRKYQR